MYKHVRKQYTHKHITVDKRIIETFSKKQINYYMYSAYK